jgi:hypothetical protein
MKCQERRGADGDRDLSDPFWTEEERPKSAQQPIAPRQVRRAVASTLEDDELLFEQQILRDHRSHATGTARFAAMTVRCSTVSRPPFMCVSASGRFQAPRNVA